jgi:hypothetical protein
MLNATAKNMSKTAQKNLIQSQVKNFLSKSDNLIINKDRVKMLALNVAIAVPAAIALIVEIIKQKF